MESSKAAIGRQIVRSFLSRSQYTLTCPPVIPDYAKLTVYSRAPSKAEVAKLAPRVKSCCAAGALASGTQAEFSSPSPSTFDLRQNVALGDAFADVFRKHYGPIDRIFGIAQASTDFGNISYALPGLHPGFCECSLRAKWKTHRNSRHSDSY